MFVRTKLNRCLSWPYSKAFVSHFKLSSHSGDIQHLWRHSFVTFYLGYDLAEKMLCCLDPMEISEILIYLCLLPMRTSMNRISLTGCLAMQNALCARLQ